MTFSDLSTVVGHIDAAAARMEARLAELRTTAKTEPHMTYDERSSRGGSGAGMPSDPAERWPVFMLRKWQENRQLMRDEIASTGFWNLNRFVYSQASRVSGWG